ncbi:MAG: PCRF domain-containing protein [Planctomycetota bacterium]|nr:MAG: PCRF domain-containing protein [Planctomycetota bacterium]
MAESGLTDKVRKKLDDLLAQDAELARRLEDPAVLTDHRQVRDLSIRRAAIAPVVEGYQRYRTLMAEAEELRETIEASEDAELVALAREELPEVEARAEAQIEQVKQALVSSDDRQVGSVILEIRAGTGGDEAGLWARDLLDVYRRYASARGWAFEEMELVADPSVGGIRHAVVNIRGQGVWQELSFEAGVHSVKRVPATETQGRIHTSTCTVAVLPEPSEVEVSIDWANDVTEHVTTAQGPGGQNVNKVATAVHLVHEPTGIEVRMQETKSQAQNREKARRLLAARVYELERQRAAAERAAERKEQIGTAQRSEKIRVYRYQDNIVADQRLDRKFTRTGIIDEADLKPLFEALIEQETARRLAEL